MLLVLVDFEKWIEANFPIMTDALKTRVYTGFINGSDFN